MNRYLFFQYTADVPVHAYDKYTVYVGMKQKRNFTLKPRNKAY